MCIRDRHDGQQLLDEEQHLAYLDSFGKVDSLLAAYADKYNALTDIRRKMNALQMDEAEKARRMDTLQYQRGELERAKLKSGCLLYTSGPGGRRRRDPSRLL